MSVKCAGCWQTHELRITHEEWMVIDFDALFCPHCGQTMEAIPVMQVRGEDG